MKAAASLTVTTSGYQVSAQAPLSIRRASGRFVFVSTAAAPVCGDELAITVELGPGVTAEIGSVAATIVWPGPDGAPVGPPSRTTTRIRVGDGAHLVWAPEPTVSVAGSDHIARTEVELGDRATCRIVEEYALGRHGEPCGTLVTELRLTRAGQPLVHHGERFTPGAPRHVLAAVLAGDPPDPFVTVGDASAACLPSADAGVTLVLGQGPDRPATRSAARFPAGA